MGIKPVNRDCRDLLAEFNAHGVEYLINEADLTEPGLIFPIGIPPVRIDILTAIDGVEFSTDWPARMITQFADQPVAVLSREHLIQTNRAAGQTQDMADIE